MLNAIKNFFNDNLAGAESQEDLDHQLRLASAALMIEIMEVDEKRDDLEHSTVVQSLREKFALSQKETDELISLAASEAKNATDYHQFTSLITQHYSPEKRAQLIEYLWEIAYADGELDKYEEHLIRKINDLLYLSHETFITAKHRAETNAIRNAK